jgi:hypothetical protein
MLLIIVLAVEEPDSPVEPEKTALEIAVAVAESSMEG